MDKWGIFWRCKMQPSHQEMILRGPMKDLKTGLSRKYRGTFQLMTPQGLWMGIGGGIDPPCTEVFLGKTMYCHHLPLRITDYRRRHVECPSVLSLQIVPNRIFFSSFEAKNTPRSRFCPSGWAAHQCVWSMCYHALAFALRWILAPVSKDVDLINCSIGFK